MMLCLGAVGGATVVAPVTANAAIAQAPTIKVQGQVVDETGAPLMGASIKAKNSKTGTVTDMDGKFSLDVESNATLIVSYLGYKTSEVAVRGRAIIEKIQLTPDNNVLNQVVVVGYGTQKKADLTGSVAIVNAEEMKKVSNSNISTMLEGKVAGVQITSDGQPGADPSVRIRGIGSFGSTAPLYVVDVYLWVPPFATSRLTTSRPSRFLRMLRQVPSTVRVLPTVWLSSQRRTVRRTSL